MSFAGTIRGEFARAIAVTFFAKVAASVLGMLGSIIVARSLGPEGRGAFAAVVALAGIGTQFANLGLHSSNIYFLSQDRGLLTPIVANSVMVALGCGTLASAALAVVAWWTGMGQSTGLGLIGLALVGVPISLAYMLLSSLLIAMAVIRRYNQIDIGLNKVATVALTLAVVFFHVADPAWYLGAALLGQVLALAAVWLILGQTPASLKAVSFDLLRRQVPFAFRAYLACIFGFMLLRVDMLMVQNMTGNAEAGHYSIAVAMADLIYMLPATAGTLLFPRLSANADAASRRHATWRMLVGVGLTMSALALVAVVLAAPAISLLFGPSYLPAAPMFHILVVAIVLYGMNTIVSNHLAAEGFPWSSVWAWLVALAVNVALNIFLIPHYGGRGAALASLVAYGVVLTIQIPLVFNLKSNPQ